MGAYVTRRLLLIIPTLLGIMVINFLIIQFAPGGPVEQTLAELSGLKTGLAGQIGGTSGSDAVTQTNTDQLTHQNEGYRGSAGLPKELIERIEKQYGFDKPLLERFLYMIVNYIQFDFGESYYSGRSVIDMIKERLPVSISLGLWSTLIAYLISIPLGIRKAVLHGTKFDISTSVLIIIGYAIPGFLFAILLVILFAGGNYWQWFPLRGLTSDHFADLSWWQQILDYLWHITLPTISMVIGSFATLTILTKNSFLDEINKQYVLTAQAKGCTERRVLYNHVFRNAMLIVVAGMPSALVGIFFTSGLLVEYIFSLNGLGLLSFEAVINRDYPVVFATLYIFTLIGLLLKLVSDLTYIFIDPRIDFESR